MTIEQFPKKPAVLNYNIVVHAPPTALPAGTIGLPDFAIEIMRRKHGPEWATAPWLGINTKTHEPVIVYRDTPDPEAALAYHRAADEELILAAASRQLVVAYDRKTETGTRPMSLAAGYWALPCARETADRGRIAEPHPDAGAACYIDGRDAEAWLEAHYPTAAHAAAPQRQKRAPSPTDEAKAAAAKSRYEAVLEHAAALVPLQLERHNPKKLARQIAKTQHASGMKENAIYKLFGGRYSPASKLGVPNLDEVIARRRARSNAR
jgi:hypothetical protein